MNDEADSHRDGDEADEGDGDHKATLTVVQPCFAGVAPQWLVASVDGCGASSAAGVEAEILGARRGARHADALAVLRSQLLVPRLRPVVDGVLKVQQLQPKNTRTSRVIITLKLNKHLDSFSIVSPSLNNYNMAVQSHQADTRRCIDVGLTLVQRRRRWTNVKLAFI